MLFIGSEINLKVKRHTLHQGLPTRSPPEPSTLKRWILPPLPVDTAMTETQGNLPQTSPTALAQSEEATNT